MTTTQKRPIRGASLSADDLRSSFRGQVISPGQDGYEQSRTLFYGGFDRRPALVIRPIDAQDVVRAVRLARESGLELAVRSGGHSLAGHSVCEGGLVLDLRNLNSLQIDPAERTAWVGPGLTAGEYTKAAAEFGLATGFGDTGSVGIGGIVLGGGIGFLVRKHGLTIDSLLAAEIVTADGQLLTADEQHHPDLFWAIRGGGGNFGVVTRLKLRLHELGQGYGGMLILPAEPQVIAGFMRLSDEAPEELSTICNVMGAPPMPFLPPETAGKIIVMAMLFYAGPPVQGQAVIAPFRALAEPLADMLRPMSYTEMFPPEEGEFHPMAVDRSMFVDHIGLDEAETILRHLQASDAMMKVAQLRALGGAMGRVPADATAFAHRHAKNMVNLAAIYMDPAEREKHEAWVTQFAREMYQGDSGVNVNFIGDGNHVDLHDAYPGSTYERLAQVKARYDPDNLFHLNHNILPQNGAAH